MCICRTMLCMLLVIVLFSNTPANCGEAQNPTVTIPLGTLEGYWTRSVNNRQYIAFDGIPYAIPPIGKYRFEEPLPIKSWTAIWKANTEYTCLQYNHYTEPNEDFLIGDEDCLYLNVYTPEVNNTKNYDVIIYIHGGAFMFGSGAIYGHRYIMDKDVVYVSLNYRLGPLGFLSTEDEVLPGNLGLKDQLLALKWIKGNIQYFGGNPNSITLTGMSAGGASVHIHYISPLSEGLFHRGIAQSGSALNNWVLAENSLEKAKKLADIVGCNNSNSRVLVNCLKTRNGHHIVDSVKYFLSWLYNPFSLFGVVVDKFSKTPVLPEHPLALIKKGRSKSLPLIFSCVESEGLYPAADFLREPEYLTIINDKWNKLIPYILDFNYTISHNERRNVSERIRNFYFKNKKIQRDFFPILIKMISNRLFIADIELSAKLHAKFSNASTYFYYFSYRGVHSKSETRSKTNENFGAAHGDDTVYVLSSNVNTRTSLSDIKMTDILLNMWINYAKSSTPQFSGFNSWEPMKRDFGSQIQYMHIASPEKIQMKITESLGDRQFWHSLGFCENLIMIKME